MIEFKVNGRPIRTAAQADTPLLWFLRDTLGLTGTKFGCGKGLCGACTVHVDGHATRACLLPIGMLQARTVLTIEGLSANAEHPVQQAWIALDVPQCGYCQPGQIMAAAALLRQRPRPTDEDIDVVMSGVLCRCGTYGRIRRAIHLAAELAQRPV